jgi:hypothetical protein
MSERDEVFRENSSESFFGWLNLRVSNRGLSRFCGPYMRQVKIRS